MPSPAALDWDLWIGPAPMRPYHSCHHPMLWRCWWDFGCGMMGDRGTHTVGNVAKRFPNRKLLWDNDNMKVTNLDEANEWVRRPYRKRWSL